MEEPTEHGIKRVVSQSAELPPKTKSQQIEELGVSLDCILPRCPKGPGHREMAPRRTNHFLFLDDR